MMFEISKHVPKTEKRCCCVFKDNNKNKCKKINRAKKIYFRKA